MRRYNNAVRKAAKTAPQFAKYLPELVSYREVKAGITNRRALQNTVNRLNRATRPGAMNVVSQADGSVVTVYERKEYAILRSVVNRKKNMKAREKGVTQPEVGGSLEQARLSTDRRPISSISAKGVRRYIENMQRELNMSSIQKAQRYWSNYSRALWEVFGNHPQFDAVVREIEGIIIRLAGKGSQEVINAINDAPSIEFIYSPQELDAKISILLDYWRSADEYEKIR